MDASEPDLEALRQRLRAIAEKISPRVIADKSGVSHATIYRWIGEDPVEGTYRSTVSNIRRFVEDWESGGVPRETPFDRMTETGPSYRVTAGLPNRVRVWLQEELAVYAKSGVSEDLFVDARNALESSEVIGFFVGGGATDRKPPEEDILAEMKLMARAIRRRLRRGGARQLSPDPVE